MSRRYCRGVCVRRANKAETKNAANYYLPKLKTAFSYIFTRRDISPVRSN